MQNFVRRQGGSSPVRVAVALILLLLATIAWAERDSEILRINREVARLIARGWVDDALPLAEKAVRLGESVLAEEDPAFVEALKQLAAVQRQTGDREQARTLYERVLTIQERSLGPEHPDLASCLDDLAAVYQAARSFDEATALYGRALKLREAALGAEDPELIGTLTSLAGVHQVQGDFAAARPLLERAIAIQEKQLGPDHPELVNSLRFLAAICHAQQDMARAKALTNRAQELEGASARLMPPADPERGAIGITIWANSAGEGGSEKGRMYAAKLYFIRVDDHAEGYKAAGKVWANYSWAERTSLARRTTDFVESNFNQQGDIFLLNAEPGRYVIVGALFVLSVPGQNLAYRGYFSTEIVTTSEITVEAGQMVFAGDLKASARGAADPTQRFFFHSTPPVTGSVVNVRGLGSVHYKTTPQWIKFENFERGGKSESAFWRRAQRVFKHDTTWLSRVPDPKTAVEPTPPHQGKIAGMSQRALDDLSNGQYKAALASAAKALKTCESAGGEEVGCLAAALGNLAELTAMADPPAAEPLLRRQLELRERTLGAQHPAVAGSLSALARLSNLGGRREEAESLEQRALEILEGTLGPEHPALADSLEFLAGLGNADEDDEQTVALLERALRIREDALGWTHSTVAPVLSSLGQESYSGAGSDRAVELLGRALAIDERFFGEGHPNVADVLFNLARAHHAAEDFEQATALLERARSIQTNAFGSKHQAVIDTTIQLASAYERLDDADRAARLRAQADDLSQQKAIDDLTAIGNAIVNYAIDNGKYPATTEIDALKRLLQPVYIRSLPVADGWGNAYAVQSSASSYTLRCLGKDGQADAGKGGATSGFDADIILTDGQLAQWPESSRR